VNTKNKDSRNKKVKKNDCLFCDKEHELVSVCPEFKKMTIQQRWEVCFACLQKSKKGIHNSGTCEIAGVCPNDGCGKRHHRLLCKKSEKKDAAPVAKVGSLNVTRGGSIHLMTSAACVEGKNGKGIKQRLSLTNAQTSR